MLGLIKLSKEIESIDSSIKELIAAEESVRRTEKLRLKVASTDGFFPELKVKLNAAVQRQMEKLDDTSDKLAEVVRSIHCMSSETPSAYASEEDSQVAISFCSRMEIPDKEFIEELLAFRKERHKGRDEWPQMISEGNRDFLNANYFPYNSRITRTLLRDKHVMFIGDSLVRAMYKDMLALIQTGDLCRPYELRVTNENSFYGDKQIDFLELEANRVFRQAREFQSNRHLIQYFFTNRAMREELDKTCLMIEATNERPDLVIVNSAIWDVSRFPARHTARHISDKNRPGELLEEINVAEEYFNRIAMFCRRMRVLLPPTSTVIWLLFPPSTSPEVERGFMSNQHLTFDEIRARLLDANVRAAQIVREAGFDVLDISFHCRSSSYAPFRIKDGVHWNAVATRYMTQLLLGHLTTAWRLKKTVTSKWPLAIQDKVRRETRTPKFTVALSFLKDINADKHLNERVHQDVRKAALESYRNAIRYAKSQLMPVEEFIVRARTLLMVHKFGMKNYDRVNMIAKAFREMPAELAMFSQEDIQKIRRKIAEIHSSWRDHLPSMAMSYSKKRRRSALLPNPPPPFQGEPSLQFSGPPLQFQGGPSLQFLESPPQFRGGPSLQFSGSPLQFQEGPSLQLPGPSHSQQFGLPNRIANAVPRSAPKRQRRNYWH